MSKTSPVLRGVPVSKFSMKRFLFALALCGAVPLSSALSPANAIAAPASDGVAAEVNGDKIQLADLNRLVNSFKTSDPRLQANTPEAQKAVGEIKTQLLDELITTRLLAQEARRQKIVPQTKQVDDALANLRTNFKTDADFQQWLTADGQTPQDVRRVMTDELAIRELSTRLTGDISVTADDFASYYRDHLDRFDAPEAIHAHTILLAINPKASKADKDMVFKRAQGLIKQLRGGADFAALAKANSDDPASKDQGGDLPPFIRGDMIQSLEDAAFVAKEGDIVGPFFTELGVDILRIDQKIAARKLTLVEAQNDPDISTEIKTRLLKQKVQKRLDDQIAKLRASAKIQKYA